MVRVVLVLRFVIPALWIGLILGLSFIEAPLKFAAPGITVPLGLGIGRLVFTALAIAGAVLLLTLTAISTLRPRVGRSGWILLACLWALFLLQSLAIRPALGARSDIIIAGGDPGPSGLHYVYIAADVLILGLLAWWIVLTSRNVKLSAVSVHRLR